MENLSTTRTRFDFPTPRSRNAPKQFRGRFDEVGPFLEEFNRLAVAYNLSNDDKFKLITHYVSRSVRETIEGLSSYASKDWDAFDKALKNLYNYIKTDRKYRTKDLSKFARKSRETKIKDLYSFNKYRRRITRIGGWLLQREKISPSEYDKYFWKGLPPSTRNKLEHRILQMKPNWDLSIPYTAEDMTAAAEHVFSVTRFYDQDSSDGSDDDSSSESGSDSGSESESDSFDSENDSDDGKKKKKTRRTLKSKNKSKKLLEDPKEKPKAKPTSVQLLLFQLRRSLMIQMK